MTTVVESRVSEALREVRQLRKQGVRCFVPMTMTGGTKAPSHAALRATYGRPGWRHLQTAPAGEDEVRAWFTADRACQLAAVVPPGFVVIDVDRPSPDVTYPATWCYRTDRGSHAWLTGALPEGRGTTVLDRKGNVAADLLGPGRLALIPPSGGRVWAIPPEGAPASIEDARLGYSAAASARSRASRAVSGPGIAGPETEEALALKAAALWGVTPTPTRIGAPFCCPLPGHQERHPSASFHRAALGAGANGAIFLRDFHARGERTWWSLPEVHVARLTGDSTVRLAPGEKAVWTARLSHECGYRRLRLPNLDCTGLRGPAATLLEGVALLLACRGATDRLPIDRFTYTREFACRWTGLSERAVRDGLAELREARRITPIGCDGRALLYRLGA